MAFISVRLAVLLVKMRDSSFQNPAWRAATISALIDAARDAGLWKLVSRIFTNNTASRTLMKAIGFREVGIYEKHGRLDGEWRDVVIVERLIPENLRST